MAKWFKQFSFWSKLKAIIALFGAGGELTVVLTSAPGWLHAVVIPATILSLMLAQLIEDKNNNGIVDLFESTKPKKKKENEQV